MRRSFAAVISIVILLFTPALSGETSPSADMLLQRGKDNFRSGHYREAVTDLEAASAAFLTPEQKQAYIASGHLDTLPKFEESLVYLALAQSHLGNEGEARTAITRLLNAERIEPVYAGLKLDPDAGELEKIVVALMPAVPLPPNAQLAAGGAGTPVQTAGAAAPSQVPPPPATAPVEQTVMSTPAPAATPAPIFVPTGTTAEPTLTATHAPEPAAEPVQTAAVPPPPPPPADVAAPAPAPAQEAAVQTADDQSKLAVQPTLAAERASMLKAIDEQVARQVAEKVAAARAEIERDAQQKIVAEREASQRAAESRIAEARQAADKAAQERVAQERAAAQQAADQRIAEERAAAEKASAAKIAEEREAVQRAADEKIAAEREASQRAADEKIAAERAASQRAADEKIAAERAAAERATAAKLAEAEAQARRGLLASLRQADSAAANGQVADASRLYAQLASTPGVSREAVAAAAAGLYRTGDFASAVKAFQRLGTFARGEEDLRYYNAVALFETGHYDQAKKELACALPFIQVNDDVARYRLKIEQMAAQQAMR
ncbi:MAG: hypothetical protein JWN02_2465 [Acidobacteria bacterium]|nr:hypothetical protein [Acidobacteriota bacterium]